MRIGIHNPRSLISPDSVKLIEKILQLHEVHRRRRPSIKQPKLIKFEPIFLDVVIMILEVLFHTKGVISDIKSHFCLEIGGAAATFVAHK